MSIERPDVPSDEYADIKARFEIIIRELRQIGINDQAFVSFDMVALEQRFNEALTFEEIFSGEREDSIRNALVALAEAIFEITDYPNWQVIERVKAAR